MPVATKLVSSSMFGLHSAHRSGSHLEVWMIAAMAHSSELVGVTALGGWLPSKTMEMSPKAGMRALQEHPVSAAVAWPWLPPSSAQPLQHELPLPCFLQISALAAATRLTATCFLVRNEA
jgi:hypothetical protein